MINRKKSLEEGVRYSKKVPQVMEEEPGQRVLGKGAQPSAGNCALAEQKGCRTGLCHTFGISREIFYIWLKRYAREDMDSLKGRSRRPNRARKH